MKTIRKLICKFQKHDIWQSPYLLCDQCREKRIIETIKLTAITRKFAREHEKALICGDQEMYGENGK